MYTDFISKFKVWSLLYLKLKFHLKENIEFLLHELLA